MFGNRNPPTPTPTPHYGPVTSEQTFDSCLFFSSKKKSSRICTTSALSFKIHLSPDPPLPTEPARASLPHPNQPHKDLPAPNKSAPTPAANFVRSRFALQLQRVVVDEPNRWSLPVRAKLPRRARSPAAEAPAPSAGPVAAPSQRRLRQYGVAYSRGVWTVAKTVRVVARLPGDQRTQDSVGNEGGSKDSFWCEG